MGVDAVLEAGRRFRCSEAESWAWEELNLRLHPYQQSTGNRCADGCFRRSRATVGVEVKCSNSLQLSALPTRPEPCRHCADRCRPPAVHQASPPVSTCTYASTMLPQHPSTTSISTSSPTWPCTHSPFLASLQALYCHATRLEPLDGVLVRPHLPVGAGTDHQVLGGRSSSTSAWPSRRHQFRTTQSGGMIRSRRSSPPPATIRPTGSA
jgi:hypothetical protein